MMGRAYALSLTSRPLAAKGLRSYRHPGTFGWVMIGATSDADALREAGRSVAHPSLQQLQRWNGSSYEHCVPPSAVTPNLTLQP